MVRRLQKLVELTCSPQPEIVEVALDDVLPELGAGVLEVVPVQLALCVGLTEDGLVVLDGAVVSEEGRYHVCREGEGQLTIQPKLLWGGQLTHEIGPAKRKKLGVSFGDRGSTAAGAHQSCTGSLVGLILIAPSSVLYTVLSRKSSSSSTTWS